MKKKTVVTLLVVSLLCLVFVFPAFAGPGGSIAKAVAKTFWGKVAVALLIIFFLPWILYVYIKEKFSERRARRDLRFLAVQDSRFEWLRLRERAQDCFYRIHSAWSKEDMAEASEWMTAWYWQNQQMAFLDRWEREDLVNHCQVRRIKSVRPLLFVHRNDGSPHEGSMAVISITAPMQDYLARRADGQVVEGDKKWKDVETVWTFTVDRGVWKVSNIEDGACSLEYAKLVKDLPPIQETVLGEK